MSPVSDSGPIFSNLINTSSRPTREEVCGAKFKSQDNMDLYVPICWCTLKSSWQEKEVS